MPLIYSDWWPCEKMATWRQTQGEKALWRWRQWMERCSCKGAQRFPAATRSEEEARKDSLRSVREPGPLTAWSWTSRPQNCCSFKQLGLRVFVTTALGNEYTAQLGRFPGSPCTSAQKVGRLQTCNNRASASSHNRPTIAPSDLSGPKTDFITNLYWLVVNVIYFTHCPDLSII